MKPYRGWTKEGREVKGWYCEVGGKSYIILDDAELAMIACSFDFGIEGFVEVDPKTVELLEDKE
ncbi:unnamed protein product [marine sediment metagenome]|uniref:YopX protein domain-containing protein n=1 Tax=marine sediment metagenome TaxID=412755 RepID=X1HDI8_9ZZZZ